MLLLLLLLLHGGFWILIAGGGGVCRVSLFLISFLFGGLFYFYFCFVWISILVSCWWYIFCGVSRSLHAPCNSSLLSFYQHSLLFP